MTRSSKKQWERGVSSGVFSCSLLSLVWYDLIPPLTKIRNSLSSSCRTKASPGGFIHVLPVNEVSSKAFETNRQNFYLSPVPFQASGTRRECLLRVSHRTKNFHNASSSKSGNTTPRFDLAVLTNFSKLGRKRVFWKPSIQYPAIRLGKLCEADSFNLCPEKTRTQGRLLLPLTAHATYSLFGTF